jgi:predicted nuclease of predicted toxin-antitoxin system
MRLLFDQNLLPRLVTKLADHYPDSAYIEPHALDHVLDKTVWAFAREHGYILVTQNSDFHELSLVRGAPPKVVWIRRGNCITHQIEDILRKYVPDIQSLIESPDADFLLMY